jgi:hypothetical protein
MLAEAEYIMCSDFTPRELSHYYSFNNADKREMNTRLKEAWRTLNVKLRKLLNFAAAGIMITPNGSEGVRINGGDQQFSLHLQHLPFQRGVK